MRVSLYWALFFREPHPELLLTAFLPMEQGVCRAKGVSLHGVCCLPAPDIPCAKQSPFFQGWAMPPAGTFWVRGGYLYIIVCICRWLELVCVGLWDHMYVLEAPYRTGWCWMREAGSWARALSLEYGQVLPHSSQKFWDVENFKTVLLKLVKIQVFFLNFKLHIYHKPILLLTTININCKKNQI